jgi:DNA-binding transcriptional regulator YiaG
MGQPTTNPARIAERVARLKDHLKVTYFDMATLFGVRPLTVQRWVYGHYAPRLVHQRLLERLEEQHGLR